MHLNLGCGDNEMSLSLFVNEGQQNCTEYAMNEGSP